jgi:DMSO/TMAO reductase YedYZ heme-binding membrane subunit
MKKYFILIKYIQETLLVVSVLTLMVLPIMIVFYPDIINSNVTLNLYFVSHIFLFFVMIIRPLADIFTKVRWLRPLVILRKGAGVISASIVVSFILSKLMIDPSGYIATFNTYKYWSMSNYALLAHLADISAVVLIITSNNLSKKILGAWWKKIQQLSYIYFYASVLYVYLSYGGTDLLFALVIITIVTYMASVKNKNRIEESSNLVEHITVLNPLNFNQTSDIRKI